LQEGCQITCGGGGLDNLIVVHLKKFKIKVKSAAAVADNFQNRRRFFS
jgi:hypothetical protein